jgi:SecD/SecF fusion protein
MKSFFWKFVLCLVPCALATWVTVQAIVWFIDGSSRGFKFGVDLVGGTILVYEIDLRKNQDVDNKFDPVKDINVLAESLKRRIDPNDLKNIVIRPAGGEGRVEIILPTGGTYRTKKADDAWTELLEEMKKKYGLKKLDVGRGKVLELADRIQHDLSEAIWDKSLFATSADRIKLLRNAKEYWAELEIILPVTADAKITQGKWNAEAKKVEPGETLAEGLKNKLFPTKAEGQPAVLAHITTDKGNKNITAIAVGKDAEFDQHGDDYGALIWKVDGNKVTFTHFKLGDQKDQLNGFRDYVFKALVASEVQPSEKSIEQWVKKQAWEDMLERVRVQWKLPDAVKDDMNRIPPDSVEQLITFVEARGSVIGQAGLAVVEPLTGADVLGGGDKSSDGGSVEKFIKENYGPSLARIQKDINELTEKSGRKEDLTVEGVQQIKDMVAKIGSLEFRILANSTDDAAGETAAKTYVDNPDNAKELEDRAKKGLPPPGPPQLDDPKKLARFTLKLKGEDSDVTYSWVEIGQTERHSLNLDNDARNDPLRAYTFNQQVKLNKAFYLKDQSSKTDRWNGALFFARKCEDRNLPDETRREKEYEYFVLTRDPEFVPGDREGKRVPAIDGSLLKNARAGQGQNLLPVVEFEFNTQGGNLFRDITRKNVPSGEGTVDSKTYRHLAIILDGLLMSAPTINSVISTNGQISGNFTQKEVNNLVSILRAGRLPATLKPQPVSESTMGATLGQDTIEDGVRAILLAFGAVLAFMIIYYRFAGLVASVALLANLVLTVGFMVAVQATFTLPGLAGLVLMLGMAVDANVLIYERLREERERGASLAVAIRNGYERALPTIIDTHLSSIFTAIVLYVVGNDQLKGFGISLTVGLIISLFTSLFMTRLLFDFWLSKGWLHKLSMMRLFAKPDIDFMGIRNLMFVATIILAVLGITLFVGRIPYDLNIDFRGGTAYGGKLTTGLTIQDLRKLVDEDNQKKWLDVTAVKEIEGSRGYSYAVTYKNPDGKLEERIVNLSSSLIPDPPAPAKDTAEAKAEYQKSLQEIVKNRDVLVKKRASELPDASVEQIFLSQDLQSGDSGKSPNFTVRSSEKEPELVQASLDRLLRDKDGNPLMKKVYMAYDQNVNLSKNREVRLTFYEDQAHKTEANASPSFVKSLFNREIQKAFNTTDKNNLPAYEMYSEGRTDADGRVPILRVKFDNNPALKDPAVNKDVTAKIEEALRRTGTAFADRPVPDRLENFDSQLATETRFRALAAIVASWAAIMVYLWFRFGNWTFGLAAVICLIHDLFFTLGAIAACHFLHGTVIGDFLLLEDFKIDLPAVAALLTLVGYSVNDTIVVFDRIREVRGKNPDLTSQMINDSVNQTLSRTVLASLATWLVVFVLFVWGGPGVHLFAFVMVVGVIVGTYSSIYIASPLLLMLGEGHRSTAKTLERRPGSLPESAHA